VWGANLEGRAERFGGCACRLNRRLITTDSVVADADLTTGQFADAAADRAGISRLGARKAGIGAIAITIAYLRAVWLGFADVEHANSATAVQGHGIKGCRCDIGRVDRHFAFDTHIVLATGGDGRDKAN